MRYAYLAIGCAILGTVLTVAVVLACQYLGIDIFAHLWVLAIPTAVSLAVNVALIELYDMLKKK